MANDAEILTVVRSELRMVLAEDTPGDDIELAARAVVKALRQVFLFDNASDNPLRQKQE